ncbi:hypothetical protein NXZ90_16490, partial [Escherichia coli]|nr:hypothetical protein [Escherichia coli]
FLTIQPLVQSGNSLAFFKLSKGLFLRLTLRICKFAPRNKLTVITLFAVFGQEEWQYAYNDYSGRTRQSRKYWGSGAGNENDGF